MRYTNLKSIKKILELFLSHFYTVILVCFKPWHSLLMTLGYMTEIS